MKSVDAIVLVAMMALIGTSVGAILSNDPDALVPVALLVGFLGIAYVLYHLPYIWDTPKE